MMVWIYIPNPDPGCLADRAADETRVAGRDQKTTAVI